MMKLNRIILSAAVVAMTFAACDDNKMEWGTPEGQNPANLSDIPLSLAEQIACYKSIREYAAEYAPHMAIGLGIGADYYMNSEAVKQLSDENFSMFTLGNAMKHDAVVSNSGSLNFATIDAFFNAIPADAQIYGHNFIWHTQQRQAYLKSLIAPEMVVISTGNVANVLQGDASDFNGGTTGGWGSWGGNKESAEVVAGVGQDGSACLVLTNKGDGNSWEAQCAYTFSEYLQTEVTYMIKFKAKSTTGAGQLQFQYQNGTTYGSQGGYNTFSIGTNWADYEYEFTVGYEDVNRIILNFGAVGGSYYIDDIEFGLKQEGPHNYCTNGDFSDGLEGWTLNSGNDQTEVVDGEGNPSGNKKMLKLVAPESASNAWDLEIVSPKMPTLPGKKINMSFYVKSDQAGKMRCAFDGLTNNYPWMPWTDPTGSWSEGFETGTTWTYISLDIFNYNQNDFAEGATEWDIKFDMGYVPGVTYYLDDVRITEVEETATTRAATTRASSISYKLKSADEKKALLLGAMEEWISGMLTHPGMERVKAWDVINEPIDDGTKKPRGIDGVFGGSDGDGNPDSAPEETTEGGLNLNWASDHFYWGYYIGMEYATKAFEYARKYAPADTKLYVNDYNLETSPSKLDGLIDFVNYIDQHNETGAPIVDGIGTQMHVVSTLTRGEVDAMFQKLAATGKLIRITELDVRISYEATANPSAAQQQKQADAYQMVIDSYKANVPEAQQAGFTIWGLSDHADEHTYWFPGDTPCIFDANYKRKPAYKGVCDGIAGRDLSEDFDGDDWKNAYE